VAILLLVEHDCLKPSCGKCTTERDNMLGFRFMV